MGLLRDMAKAMTPRPDVTVIIPSIPERAALFARAVDSVRRQTLWGSGRIEVSTMIDVDREGPAALRSKMVASATTEWVAFLDDDDYLDPHHIETLLEHSKGVDVVIPHCRFDGPPLPDGYYNVPYRYADLRRHGIFPITVLARRRSILAAGAFRTTDRYEDHQLWNRMARMGFRFRVVPEVTWSYRTSHAERRTNGWNS